MSELVVRYGGEYLSKGEKNKASAVMKAAGLTEGAVSLAAFFVVLLTAGFAETYLAKTPNVSWMFTVYALGLLANFNTETSTGILQVTDKIKLQGTIILAQSIFTSIIIVGAYFLNGNITIILIAYLAGEIHSWAWHVRHRANTIAQSTRQRDGGARRSLRSHLHAS